MDNDKAKYKTLVVAGTFDESGGKPSSLIEKLFENYIFEYTMYNGGNYSDLAEIIQSATEYGVVFWLVNVDNSLPKLRDVKSVNPKVILITSKRNDNEKYSFVELVGHALAVKANLVIEFSKLPSGEFDMRVFDPLGVVWCDKTTHTHILIHELTYRLVELKNFTRQPTKFSSNTIEFEVEEKFFDIIKEKAEIFHKLIQPPEVVKRFLGNVSFRCVHGFPSYRGSKCIVVSKRNVDKSGMTAKDFVPIKLTDDILYYHGENKPSVDSPIQARLYKFLPKINYMLHSHTYIKGAPFTSEAIPCGALEEAESVVLTLINEEIDHNKSFCINLLGHGSLVCATDLDYFDTVEYVARPSPEYLN